MNDARFEVKPNMKSKVGSHARRRFMTCTAPDGGVGEVLETRSVQNGYEWKCSKCDGWHTEHTQHSCQFVPFWHEHLGHEPVYVDSWNSYRQELGKISPHAVNELASS